MRIEKINNYQNRTTRHNIEKSKPSISQNQPAVLTNSLEIMASLNRPSFLGYGIGLSHDELVKRTSGSRLATVKLLSPSDTAYKNLENGDKQALKHLVLAADAIGEINLQLDSPDNIPFREYLKKQIKKGDPDAKMAMTLFDAQKGVYAEDMMATKISLIKGKKQPITTGLYPANLSVEEFHQILESMLRKGKDKEVAKILSLRTVVERKGNELVGIDYVDKFKKEFNRAADELDKAAKTSTSPDFNEFLKAQAKAFRKADPILDAKADILWAKLQDTPLEFTVTRESYKDRMTTSVFDNKPLADMLKAHGITPMSKDFLGGRVGIVNKEGTDFLIKSKKSLPELAKLMPFADEYEQTIKDDNKQSMVDVDIVTATGDLGEYRGSITLAENLPNKDKLSIQIGGGRRNVYHRQMRFHKAKAVTPTTALNPAQRKNLDPNSNFYFTVGHENAHSLGPKEVHNLGKYRNIIEENKADVASISFMDKLTELGMYNEDERDSILKDFVMYNFLKAKPNITNAHRTRQIMQCKYFGDHGVYEVSPEGEVHINTELVVPTCKKMLEEVIRIQIDDNYEEAEEFINQNFVWTDEMELVANRLRENSNCLNGRLVEPLADYLRQSK